MFCQVANRTDNAFAELMFVQKRLETSEFPALQTYQIDRLVTLESYHLSDGVSYVYN